MEFRAFASIPRLSRNMVITEKIDGTNAQIVVYNDFEYMEDDSVTTGIHKIDISRGIVLPVGSYYIAAGSRTKWITPKDDNAGFAGWVWKHAEELVEGLGPGAHFGEWWGQGIQRTYGLKEKRFSLFNVGRWTEENKPSCCHIVPKLYEGEFATDAVQTVVSYLSETGSAAAPGCMNPEGVVIYHTASGYMFKKTIENDSIPKSLVK